MVIYLEWYKNTIGSLPTQKTEFSLILNINFFN